MSSNMANATIPDNPRRNTFIEDLPYLIRYEIMKRLEMSDLNALSRASPILYRQVIQDRAHIYYGRLKEELGSVLLDAYAAYQTTLPPFPSGIRDTSVVRPFLESYASRRLSEKQGPLLKDLGEDVMISMIEFQTSIVAPLVKIYTQWALEHMSEEMQRRMEKSIPPDGDGPDVSNLTITLSATERMRITRGMYRFQLLCNIVGSQGRSRPRFGSEPYFSGEEMQELFCGLFEPWEIDEIACIQYFVDEKWVRICNEFKSDIGETSPLFEEVSPPGGRRLSNPSATGHVADGTVSRGLRPMHAISFVDGDRNNIIQILHQELSWPTIEYIDFGFGGYIQWDQRRRNPTERDLKEQRRDPLPFNGDGESNEDELRPPCTWVMLWKGTYSNIYAFDDDLLYWGYVMWDKDRIEAAGAERITAFTPNYKIPPVGDLDYSSYWEERERWDNYVEDFEDFE